MKFLLAICIRKCRSFDCVWRPTTLGTPGSHPSDEDLSLGTPGKHPSDEDLSLGTPVARQTSLRTTVDLLSGLGSRDTGGLW